MVMMMKKKKNKSVICVLFVLLLAVNYATEAEAACTRRCGDVDIPIPFGIEPGCFDTGFNVVCNDSKLYYRDIQLVGIDLDYSEATILQPIATDCPDNNVAAGRSYTWSGMNLTGSPFLLSDARNIFTAIGCDAAAFFSTSTSVIGNFSDFNTTGGGCVSLCSNNATFVNGTCSGNNGCCQTAIPARAQEFTFYLSNYSGNSSSSSCHYSFLVDRSWFYLNSSWYLPGRDFYERHGGHVPVVVDWWCSDNACRNQQHPQGTPTAVPFVIISAAVGSFLIFMAVITLRRRSKKRNLEKKSKENYPGNLQLLEYPQSSSDDIVIDRRKNYEPDEMEKDTDYFNKTQIVGSEVMKMCKEFYQINAELPSKGQR